MDIYDIAIAKALAGEGGGGSSDFSAAHLTLQAFPGSGEYSIQITCAWEGEGEWKGGMYYSTLDVSPNHSETITLPLYKGRYSIDLSAFTEVDFSVTPETTGDVVYSADTNDIMVTGDGTVTLAGTN